MGERLNDGAGHSRRRAHPVDAAADDEATADAPGAAAPGAAAPALEALLVRALSSQALRAHDAQGLRGPGDGERRAVAAFRAARDAGAHKARTRRRDDWRPRVRRHTARSLRATLSVLVAGLTLGGVAFAAVGSSPHGVAGGAGRPEPAATLPGASGARSADTVSVSPRPPAATERDRPVSAEDTDAHCRAYEKVLGRGKATDSTAWQRLVTAAGGAENVVAYCEAAAAAADSGSGSAGGGPKTGKAPKAGKSLEAGAGKTRKAEPAPKAGKTPEVGQSAKATQAAKSGAEGQ
ncbi:hypothetical protein [Streptomyces sp. NBC_01334]|uniref:hypothetical protein n=1 Tax=Streptomyces sp. NBC_01334 TaxID=2903827 RepID=UPI002E12A69A|nr:hypothetical protein OG736_27285 [Streptomyces sp. NBC_01334]